MVNPRFAIPADLGYSGAPEEAVTMGKGKSPSRLRYEAAHPTLTPRVPPEVKAGLEAKLAADQLTFSEWVRQRAAGKVQAVADVAAARVAGRAEARSAYLIICAAMLWTQYGERLGDTNDSWTDPRAVECVEKRPPASRAYLQDRLRQTPSLRAAVVRWLRDCDLPALPE